MSKTVTLRLSPPVYKLFKACASAENRSLSNLIETAALKQIQAALKTQPANNLDPHLSPVTAHTKKSKTRKGTFYDPKTYT